MKTILLISKLLYSITYLIIIYVIPILNPLCNLYILNHIRLYNQGEEFTEDLKFLFWNSLYFLIFPSLLMYLLIIFLYIFRVAIFV